LNVNQSFEDVRQYLLDEFAQIHQDHWATMAMVPAPWPSPEIIDDLVEKSSGYFIYASIVIKFIDDKNFRPTERLAVIMGMKEPCFGVSFAAPDQLLLKFLVDPNFSKFWQLLQPNLSCQLPTLSNSSSWS
jgi:hypothetical protein